MKHYIVNGDTSISATDSDTAKAICNSIGFEVTSIVQLAQFDHNTPRPKTRISEYTFKLQVIANTVRERVQTEIVKFYAPSKELAESRANARLIELAVQSPQGSMVRCEPLN